MKQDRIEERFKEAVERAVPDVKDSLMKSITERKSKIMTMEKKRTVPKRWISVLVAAALVLVLGGAGLGVNYQINYRVDSVVGLDVNPSIVLELNQREKVVQARALNEDAEVVLEGMDLSGADLNVAINALIGSLLRNGYINELANSILVTVEGQDLDKETQLQERLTQEINDILQASSIEASVLGQTLQADDALTTMANTYSISQGKAALIQKIIEADPMKTVANLAPLSVNELNLLLTQLDVASTGVQTTGSSASDKAYIGDASALQIALTDAGLTEADLAWKKIEMDADDGRMVYEVEFLESDSGMEYDYEIEASTGTILKRETEMDDDWYKYNGGAQSGNQGSTQSGAQSGNQGSTQSGTQSGSGSQQDYIGEEAAKEKALAHAGVSGATFTKVEMDRDDGIVEYELDFIADGNKYEYSVNAVTGEIIKAEWEKQSTSTGGSSQNQSGDVIGESAAKAAALSHAGLEESSVTRMEVELDRDDGKMIYEIEFKCNGVEYEYEVDAYDGTILKAEADRD